MKHVIYVMFGMIVFVFPAWAELPESPMDVPVEDVLNSVELKEIGFPFEKSHLPWETIPNLDRNLRIYYPEFDIGRCIVYLYQSGQMEEDKRIDSLDRILKKHMNHPPLALFATNSIQYATGNPLVNQRMLTAALVLTAHTGAIRDVAPLLDFSALHYGITEIAMENPPFSSGWTMMGPTKFTSEQRLKLWPAQNAIISHATTTVPLLREAAVDQSLPILLRQRAVGYLLYLDKDILRSDLLKDCEREFLEKCIMIGIPSFPWKNMEKDEVKRIKEFREQSHLRLLFNKKTRGYLDRLIEEENKGSGE